MSTSTPTDTMTSNEQSIRDGAELKRMLKAAGYSQKDLADHLGFSRSHINNVVNGFSTLTLRIVVGVREFLGEPLFSLALKRARQVEAEEIERKNQRLAALSERDEKKRLEAERRAEEKRQIAINALKEEVERADTGNDTKSLDNSHVTEPSKDGRHISSQEPDEVNSSDILDDDVFSAT